MAVNQATTVAAITDAAVTTTSDAIDCRGYGCAFIEIVVTGAANWTVSLTGSSSATGTYAALSVDGTAVSKQTSTTYAGMWRGIPDWVKVVATEDVNGATCTVAITPCNA